MASIEEIFSVYSGRRLQYAIKLRILPKPDTINQILKIKANAGSGIKNRAVA